MNELFSARLGPVTRDDIITLFVGTELGAGVHRHVFQHAQDPKLVVKIDGSECFANAGEWEVWQRVKDTDLRRWFAPCVAISRNSIALIQRKTTPVSLAALERALPKVPAFFCDLKVSNWGRLNGRIVCHDYANHLLYERGMTTAMKKSGWWE